jgi:AcrR family transcriptional regulator
MSQDHTKRRYNSARRQIQARETRLHILQAARQLFTTRGYAGATMEGIAQEAGVAVETVYSAFRSKRAVLARLVDLAVAGDEEPIPLLERPGPQRVRAESDQRQQIRLFAHDIAQIMERVGPLFGVMRSAAITEPEIALLLQRLLADRHESMAVFVGWVERNGPLRVGLSANEAADSVWTLSSAEVHHLLRVDRVWTVERYEQWLGDSLIALMLPPEAVAAE